jgi:MraZ protein
LAIPMDGGFVGVLPPPMVASLYEKIAAVPMADSEAQEEIGLFFASAQDFAFDKQGRIALNEALRSHAGIGREAVLVGSMSRFSIYSSERWSLVQQRKAQAGPTSFMRKYNI